MTPDCPASPPDWPRPPWSPIPATLRVQLRELNRGFLELLGDEPGIAGPAPWLDALADLAPDARELIADCPVTLFNLRFEQTAFWAEPEPPIVAEADVTPYLIGAPRSFVGTALFFAWHVVQCSELAARLLLAMPSATYRAFRLLPLAQLDRYAQACPGLLLPRWIDHPCFWPDLLAAAARGDQVALDAALLSGIQLVFKEVEPAALPARDDGARRSRHTRPR
jgi:hypothetical protein